ncbi:thioesterase II family protein [Brenneria tiliae]|uniref:Alpha/beta fold hydrolase n=1 Tax=Brenneria tiliae TaxID=2914984 RepID=A0ABT0N2Z3_9GAMM|nr:alpha/beta fold hydrolase [Brenneria tiliae]MCL2895834.1 alpha/beta fold hydrolase [Brenneria tiliae]
MSRIIVYSPLLRHLGGRINAPIHLICFPHAGGSASYFRSWAEALPAEIALFALQLPLREERIDDEPVTSIGSLIKQLWDQLSRVPRQQRILFGHSMGATLAWELALALQKKGIPPRHLFISGQMPPDHTRQTQFHRAEEDVLIAEVARFSATPPLLFEHPDIRELVLAQLRHDYALIENWQPTTRSMLYIPITFFHGLQDSEVTESAAQEWSRFTRGTFQLRCWPGDHFYLNLHWRAMLQQITLSLDIPVHYPDMP